MALNEVRLGSDDCPQTFFLVIITYFNLLFKTRLAKEELKKQELRQRVRIADNEVMDAFRKIMAARQKKRTPTKKEKDQAWKALKERESILKLLDS